SDLGEWLLFNSLWQGAREMSDGWSRVVLPLCVSLLGIVGAVAVATMVKWFGIIFLGQPRSNQMLYATEVEPSQHWAMFIGVMLALASILYPFGFLSIIHIPIQTLSGSDFSAGNLESSQVYGVIMTLSELAGASLKYIILVFLLGSAIHLLNRNVIRKTGPSWNCGGDLTPRMQYSAAGVTMPIRIVFRRILGSNPLVEKEFTGARYFLNSLKYRGELKAVFEDILYRPSKASLLWLAKKIRFIQTGNIHLYLGYVLITLVVVLFLGN
ncbi:MAG: oxidoreductase, partial [Desulfitobacterium hafniense]|nr:oxidoreductase [Desulfitobacterium hafniense]